MLPSWQAANACRPSPVTSSARTAAGNAMSVSFSSLTTGSGVFFSSGMRARLGKNVANGFRFLFDPIERGQIGQFITGIRIDAEGGKDGREQILFVESL